METTFYVRLSFINPYQLINLYHINMNHFGVSFDPWWNHFGKFVGQIHEKTQLLRNYELGMDEKRRSRMDSSSRDTCNYVRFKVEFIIVIIGKKLIKMAA